MLLALMAYWWGAPTPGPPPTPPPSVPVPNRSRGGVGPPPFVPDTHLVFPEKAAPKALAPRLAWVEASLHAPQAQVEVVLPTWPTVARVTAAFETPHLGLKAGCFARSRVETRFQTPGLASSARSWNRFSVDSHLAGPIKTSMVVKHEVFSAEEMTMILLMLNMED